MELKSCPFCGGEASLRSFPRISKYKVRCDNRKCGGGTKRQDSEEAAVERWNKRAYE